MIKELSELGKNLRAGKDESECNALKPELISTELVISNSYSLMANRR
jgi:hypothetical protein